MFDPTKISRFSIPRALAVSGPLALVVGGALALAAGCHDGGEGKTTVNPSAKPTASAHPSSCAGDARAETYKVGMKGTSKDGALTITFEDADPSPPAKGENKWVVTITDAAGKPVDGATIEAKAYMPDHGHESTARPKAAPMGEHGRYEIKSLDLSMPGLWEVTITVKPQGGAPEAVKFTFCIAG